MLILCGVALAFAMITTVLTSFFTQDGVKIIPGFTLRNYLEAVTNPLYQITMARSLVISIVTTAITVAQGCLATTSYARLGPETPPTFLQQVSSLRISVILLKESISKPLAALRMI